MILLEFILTFDCEETRNEKIANMKNPFKFGTVVEDEFFTDRIEELQQVKQTLNSDNHRSLGDGFFTRFGNIRFNNGQVGSGSEGEDEFALISFRNFTGNRK